MQNIGNMNHEKWMERTQEQFKIVSLYIVHLKKGEKEEFPYSKRELRKALQAVFALAVKHRRLINSNFYRRIEKEYLETEHHDEAPSDN